jgi:hypothetical protein
VHHYAVFVAVYNSFFERVNMVQQHERLTQQERSAALKAEERALAALLKVISTIDNLLCITVHYSSLIYTVTRHIVVSTTVARSS